MKHGVHNDERGAAVIEYVVVVAGIALTAMMSLQMVGGSVQAMFADITTEIADNDSVDGTCPTGWQLISNTQTKKNGQDVDANGDGLICRKDIPGKGKGNTNANANVKDNNGG